MDEKTKRLYAFGAFAVLIVCIVVFQTDIQKMLNGGAGATVAPWSACGTPGEVKTVACTSTSGPGLMTMTCDVMARTWSPGTCSPMNQGGSTTPTTLYSPTTALLVCQEAYSSWNVVVADSLDEDAKPMTLLAETVRIVSSSGQEVAKANTSTSGPTEFKVPCKMDTVTFMTTGDNIYTADTVIIKGQTYGTGQVPTYYMKDSVPVAVNIEPAYIPVKRLGNISAKVWNADDSTRANTSSIILGASESTGNKVHFMVTENDDDEAGQGIIALFKYDVGELKSIAVEGITAGTSAEKDNTQIINTYSIYETGFRLYRNNQPLTLDRDSRTDDPSEAEFIVELTATSSNPAFQLDLQPIDSDRYLAASGTQIAWAENGKFMGQDADLTNLGISATYEHNNTAPGLGGNWFIVE